MIQRSRKLHYNNNMKHSTRTFSLYYFSNPTKVCKFNKERRGITHVPLENGAHSFDKIMIAFASYIKLSQKQTGYLLRILIFHLPCS